MTDSVQGEGALGEGALAMSKSETSKSRASQAGFDLHAERTSDRSAREPAARTGRRGILRPVTLLALAPLLATPASAARIEGVEFPDRVTFAEPSASALELRGVGLLRYRLLFRAYVAALYLGEDVPAGRVLDDVPKRLEIEYFWDIPAGEFGRAADRLLARTLSEAELAPFRKRLDRLHASYEDVQPGDRYALTYRPGVGTELAKNGRPLAQIPGADFASIYFSIWLGDEPIDGGLREQLLGMN